jgi:uncharacterized protein YciI
MYFAVYCLDKDDGLPRRVAARPAHLDYLKSLGTRLKLAGPILDDAGEASVGSLLIIEADSLAEARTLAAGDPYGDADVFKSVEVRPWRNFTGEWLEGI